MKNYYSSKTVYLTAILLSLTVLSANAQSKINVDFGADIVSSYVWRGVKAAGASIQPSINAGLGGFTLGAWGSTDITSNEGTKEVDFTASYEVAGLKLAVTDYWWDGEGQFRYFSSPNNGNSGHLLEGTIGYTLPEAFPLSVTLNTFLLGKGNKKENGDNAYSTYIEFAYPFSIQGLDMGVSTGFTPWKNTTLKTANGIKFTSVALHASKSIKITESFSLPIVAAVIANPAHEDIHFVFGISLK